MNQQGPDKEREMDDGGPAFPCTRDCCGVSLRAFFVAAIAGGDAGANEGWGHNSEVTDDMIERRVCLYYRIADAMLAKRVE